MRYLFIKTYRDITKNWVQFLAVFIMAVLSVAIYSGMEGVWHGLDHVVVNYYEQTNLADAWIYSESITPDEIDGIKNAGYVENASMSMSFPALLESQSEDESANVKLRTLNKEDTISIPLLQEGNEFSYDTIDAIWLDTSFANEHNLQVDSKITLSYQTKSKEFVVAGLVLNSEYIYYTGSTTEIVPNHSRYGYGYITETAAEDFLGGIIYNEARIKLRPDYNHNELVNDTQSIFGEKYLDTIVKDEMASANQITKEINQMKIMAQMFSFVFILLALLTMYTTMSRLISVQTVSIGSLKALGFCNRGLRLHYSLYGAVISIAGGLLGSIIGPAILSPAVMRVKKATLTLPLWEIKLSLTTYVIVALITVICIASCILAARKGLKEMPAVTMRGAAPKSGGRGFLEFIPGLWKRLSFEWHWIFRGMNRSKVRTLIGIIGVLGGLTLIIAGFGFKDSIDYSNDYVYSTQYKYQEKLLLNRLNPEDKIKLESMAGHHQWIFEAFAEFSSAQKEKNGLLTVLDKGELYRFENLNQEEIGLPKEGVLINRKLAHELGINRGDALEIHIRGTRTHITATVSEIIYSPAPQGIFMSRAYYEALGEEFSPTGFLAGDHLSSNSPRDISSVQNVVTIADQEENMETMSKSVMSIIYLLIMASIILSVVILYNLGTLSYIERYREYATMKVLGFYTGEIRSLILRENIFTLFIGGAIGIPVGIAFLSKFIGVVAFESFEWIPHITPLSFTIASCVVVFCSITVTLILGYRTKKVNMVEALKSVE